MSKVITSAATSAQPKASTFSAAFARRCLRSLQQQRQGEVHKTRTGTMSKHDTYGVRLPTWLAVLTGLGPQATICRHWSFGRRIFELPLQANRSCRKRWWKERSSEPSLRLGTGGLTTQHGDIWDVGVAADAPAGL